MFGDQDELLGLNIVHEELANGLSVVLIGKPDFQQTYAMFSTRYGSIDNHFRRAEDTEDVRVPDGIAHFLEHKMFEEPDGNVFAKFAAQGASANAFTTFDMTSYLFSSAENVESNISTLLNFVQRPYFTPENVEKEKGIIGQEIRMYDDNPEWRAFFGLLRALYSAHPIRVDIAGTVESIAEITKMTLDVCYQTFYHPSNMVLVVAGGFDPTSVLATIRENQDKKEFSAAGSIVRHFPDEPPTVAKERVVATLSVAQPRCLIGWKDAPAALADPEILRRDFAISIVLDAVFGRSSDAYHALIDEGLIDQQFSSEYDLTRHYGYSVVGGNTSDPDRLVSRINEIIDDVIQRGLAQASFERSRRKMLGRFVVSMDSPRYIARTYASYFLRGIDMLETSRILEDLTLDQVNDYLRQHFHSERQAVSIVMSNDPSGKMNIQ